jgi:hypothetical protein
MAAAEAVGREKRPVTSVLALLFGIVTALTRWLMIFWVVLLVIGGVLITFALVRRRS